MEMKQVYEALEKVENGADLIAAIKGEFNTLNNEAKKHRTAGEQSATKLKSILEAVSVRRRIKITRPKSGNENYLFCFIASRVFLNSSKRVSSRTSSARQS